jgi:hypothetical protein
MANFKSPNLCGANAKLNLLLLEIEALETTITLAKSLSSSAAAIVIGVATTKAKAALLDMLPDLPELPNLNLQADILSLLAIDSSTVAGAKAYSAKLKDIIDKYGDKLKEQGKTVESLVKSLVEDGTAAICSIVPNIEIPAAGGFALEKAQAVKTALEDAKEENLAQIKENDSLAEAYVERQKVILKDKITIDFV